MMTTRMDTGTVMSTVFQSARMMPWLDSRFW